MSEKPSVPVVMLVLTTLPDDAAARRMEMTLLSERLVACVNRLGDVSASYLWKGVIEEAREVALLCKTTSTRLDALERRVRELHPYEVPEFLAWPATRVSPAYAAWVAESCVAPDPA